MTTRERLHQLVDELGDIEAEAALVRLQRESPETKLRYTTTSSSLGGSGR